MDVCLPFGFFCESLFSSLVLAFNVHKLLDGFWHICSCWLILFPVRVSGETLVFDDPYCTLACSGISEKHDLWWFSSPVLIPCVAWMLYACLCCFLCLLHSRGINSNVFLRSLLFVFCNGILLILNQHGRILTYVHLGVPFHHLFDPVPQAVFWEAPWLILAPFGSMLVAFDPFGLSFVRSETFPQSMCFFATFFVAPSSDPAEYTKEPLPKVSFLCMASFPPLSWAEPYRIISIRSKPGGARGVFK